MTQPQHNRIFDSLAYVNKLKGAGVNEKQATVHAETLFAVLDNHLLTKEDIYNTETRLSADIKDVEVRLTRDIRELDAKIDRLDAKIDRVEAKLGADIKNLDARIDRVEAELKADIKWTEHRIIIKLGSLMVVLITLLGGFMKALITH